MTAPMIGNYGVNSDDPESARPQIAGVVVRELSRSYSNWRADGDLLSWLERAGVPALEGVDTRRLTRHLRSAGVMRGVVARGSQPTREALLALDSCPPMEGLDLASVVSTPDRYDWGKADAPYHIVAYDFGIKRNILRLFEEHGCRVTVVPAKTSADEALQLEPNGVFLSNGPGDPAAVDYAPETVRQIAGVVMRELSRSYSNWRADGDLLSWLERAGVPALEGVDTRRLTRHLRSAGVMRGVVARGSQPTREALTALDACPPMEGLDLASVVTTPEPYTWGNPDAPYHIVAYDFGIKRNILRLFAEHDCRVTVVPAKTSGDEALQLGPNGVFLSNGPGDPAAVD